MLVNKTSYLQSNRKRWNKRLAKKNMSLHLFLESRYYVQAWILILLLSSFVVATTAKNIGGQDSISRHLPTIPPHREPSSLWPSSIIVVDHRASASRRSALPARGRKERNGVQVQKPTTHRASPSCGDLPHELASPRTRLLLDRRRRVHGGQAGGSGRARAALPRSSSSMRHTQPAAVMVVEVGRGQEQKPAGCTRPSTRSSSPAHQTRDDKHLMFFN